MRSPPRYNQYDTPPRHCPAHLLLYYQCHHCLCPHRVQSTTTTAMSNRVHITQTYGLLCFNGANFGLPDIFRLYQQNQNYGYPT